MLIRVRLLPVSQFVLLAGLLFAAAGVLSAQSAGSAPTQPSPALSPANAPGSASSKPQTPPVPAVNFEDVVRRAETEGRNLSIRNYVAEDLGIKAPSVEAPPLQAHALEDKDNRRMLYVVDDTGDLLFMSETADTAVVYLANHAGVLQQAGSFTQGRFHSQRFERIPKEKAGSGFNAEKEFWIKAVSTTKTGYLVKSGQTISKPEIAKSAVNAGEKAQLDRKAAQAPATKADADAAEKEKLSHMTPSERSKYLAQQKREAKKEAKLEKKEEKELAAKKAKDKKDSQAANSGQQTDDDADSNTPKKKKSISWF
ncbi:MAG: hypothetical protein ABSD13_17260 [Candidatus Korobacteraceae bacterium]|jgi:hypothetical protein